MTNRIVLIYLLGLTAILPAHSVAEEPAKDLNGKLSLRKCVGISLNNSRLVKIGKEWEKDKQAAMDEYRAAYWPRVSFAAQALLEEYDNAYPKNINARWVIFDRGRRVFALQKAKEDYRSSRWQGKLTCQEVIYFAAAAYIQVSQCKEVFLLAEEELSEEKRRLGIVEAKSEEGLVPKLDVVSVEAEVRQAQITLARARSALKRSRFSLNHAMGLDLDETVEIEEIDYNRWNKSADEYREVKSCLRQALLNRLDYKIAESVLKAAEADVKKTSAEAGPQVLLETSYYLPPERDEDFIVGLTLDIPLFEGGLRKAQRRKARAQVDIAQLEREELAKRIAKQIADTHEQVGNLRREMHFQEERLSLLSQTLKAQKDLYYSGLSDISKLNDARQDYISSRLKSSQIKGDILLYFLLLLKEMEETESFLLRVSGP